MPARACLILRNRGILGGTELALSRDGETLVFEGTSTVVAVRLPQTRRWFMNADQRFLGTDELRASSE